MNLYLDSVQEFMDAFDQTRYHMINKVPHKVIQLRAALIEEEFNEFKAARNREDTLDALVDLIYVIQGTALACGLLILPTNTNEHKHLDEIHFVLDELNGDIPCAKRLTCYMSVALGQIECFARRDGYNLNKAFMAVHANNMNKLWDTVPESLRNTPGYIITPKGDKYLVKSAEGKVIKPLNHTKVDLRSYV